MGGLPDQPAGLHRGQAGRAGRQGGLRGRGGAREVNRRQSPCRLKVEVYIKYPKMSDNASIGTCRPEVSPNLYEDLTLGIQKLVTMHLQAPLRSELCGLKKTGGCWKWCRRIPCIKVTPIKHSFRAILSEDTLH